jgi:uncharacterized protein YkwD
MLELIDRVRARHGLGALGDSPSLTSSARRYSSLMLKRDFFGHSSRIYASHRFRLRAENLASSGGWRPRPLTVLRRWLRSPAHRSLILSRQLRFAGAGMRRGRLGRRLTTVWTLHLGRR